MDALVLAVYDPVQERPVAVTVTTSVTDGVTVTLGDQEVSIIVLDGRLCFQQVE